MSMDILRCIELLVSNTKRRELSRRGMDLFECGVIEGWDLLVKGGGVVGV
jgi:hypothetical protein